MKTENGIPMENPAVAALPKHLLQFAVDQRYDDYTPIDHAVWRFIMRQNGFFLKEYAHKVYFQGLLDTGISFERIPRIDEMNEILGKIGWGAVAVDGFIPPAAFMEFQAYKVLVIACDMRQLHHIEYTPAPDIVHEAAGHAPIIVDREYSDYLQRFGEIGAKAMSSKKDFELYEAIRHLSILKELPDSDPEEVSAATRLVEEGQKNLGEPSEMALLSRLHWWTVEYGLIGTMEKPKIYGAGLLSSIGESVSCLESGVKKLAYSIDATETAFDITTKQPQLFVCRDFTHLSEVLEEFANQMAFEKGGLEGVEKAIDSHNTATCEYSSSLQVSGVFTEVLTDAENQPIYLRTTGPTALATNDKQLAGHGPDYHKDGFGSPIGLWKETEIAEGKKARLEFASGVVVEGKVEKILRHGETLQLITFSECTAKLGERVCSIHPGVSTTWRSAKGLVPSLTARPIRTLTTKSHSSLKIARSRAHPTRSGRSSKAFTTRCAISAPARRATNGSAKFGKRSRPSTLAIGCSRWKSSRSSTKSANSPSSGKRCRASWRK
ncbi:MAG: aromatic amino acid hydroxylase [Chthoniobacterales bacterium]